VEFATVLEQATRGGLEFFLGSLVIAGAAVLVVGLLSAVANRWGF